MTNVTAQRKRIGLSKRYRRARALSHVTLSIGRDECVGVVGPNGADKGTLLKWVGVT